MLSRRGFALALSLALTVTPAASRAGDCAPASGRVMLVTPTTEELPPNGALVLSIQPDASGASPFDGAQFPTNTYLTRGRARIDLRLEQLAPGLARLVPAQTPAPGEWTLHGSARPVTLRFNATAKPAPAAPAVSRLRIVTHGLTSGPPGPSLNRHSGPSNWQTVDLETRGGLPDHVYAVIARWGGAAQPPGAFAAMTATATATLWTSYVSRCGFTLPGVLDPNSAPNPSTALRYVDAWGRVSADTTVPLAR